MRYYSKRLKCEVFMAGADTLTSEDIPWWFRPLDEGYHVEYESDGKPLKVKDVLIPTQDTAEVDKHKAFEDWKAKRASEEEDKLMKEFEKEYTP